VRIVASRFDLAAAAAAVAAAVAAAAAEEEEEQAEQPQVKRHLPQVQVVE
jgi:mevalonate pyrophosphate decarboxylase